MEVSKKKDLMKKLKMPGKPQDSMLQANPDEMDLDSPESMPEEPSEDAQPLEGKETPEEEAKEIHEVDDKMLVDELKRRGFKVEPPAKGSKPEPEEGSPEEEASESPEEEQSEQE